MMERIRFWQSVMFHLQSRLNMFQFGVKSVSLGSPVEVTVAFPPSSREPSEASAFEAFNRSLSFGNKAARM